MGGNLEKTKNAFSIDIKINNYSTSQKGEFWGERAIICERRRMKFSVSISN